MALDLLGIFDNVLSDSSVKNDQWVGKRFAKIRAIQIDKRGEVGEIFVESCFRAAGKKVHRNNATDPTQKDWDLVVVDDNVCLEIKTASLGGTGTFQHENLDRNRRYDGILFLDIAPEDLYLRFFAKHVLPWKVMHRRKDGIVYKWDWRQKSIQGDKISDLQEFMRRYDEMLSEINDHKAKQKPKHQR